MKYQMSQEQFEALKIRILDEAAIEYGKLNFKATQLSDDLAEMQASADLRWKADQRAIKMWQKATGKIEVWPDHADLCVWLLEQVDGLRVALDEEQAEIGSHQDARIKQHNRAVKAESEVKRLKDELATLKSATRDDLYD